LLAVALGFQSRLVRHAQDFFLGILLSVAENAKARVVTEKAQKRISEKRRTKRTEEIGKRKSRHLRLSLQRKNCIRTGIFLTVMGSVKLISKWLELLIV